MAKAECEQFGCVVDEVVRVRRYEDGKLVYITHLEKAEAEAMRLALSDHAFLPLVEQVTSAQAEPDLNTSVLETP